MIVLHLDQNSYLDLLLFSPANYDDVKFLLSQ